MMPCAQTASKTHGPTSHTLKCSTLETTSRSHELTETLSRIPAHSPQASRTNMTLSPRLFLLATLLLWLTACTDLEVVRTCTNTQTCVCQGDDLCDFACQGAECAFECRDQSSCVLACDGGGCTAKVTTSVDAELSCAGGDCTLDCKGTGSCTLYDCTQGCGLECSTDSVCTNTCTDATCY